MSGRGNCSFRAFLYAIARLMMPLSVVDTWGRACAFDRSTILKAFATKLVAAVDLGDIWTEEQIGFGV